MLRVDNEASIFRGYHSLSRSKMVIQENNLHSS